MPSRAAPILVVLVLAGLAPGQGGDTRPGALAPADKRSVPATFAEGKRLIADLEAARAALDAEQRENPSSSKARTVQLLQDEIDAIRRLGERRQELASETTRFERASTATDEVRKRLAQTDKDEEPLPDPADPAAEAAVARESKSTDDLITEEMKLRDDASQAREKLEAERENALRKLPAAKRGLAEAKVDLTDYETDSREAISGGIAPDQGRVMVEQVYLYRLRVAESQATLDLLRYQAGDLSDVLIDQASAEFALAEEKLRRHEARRTKLDALAEKAAESRLERGRAEQTMLLKVASEAPAWARPYWELRAKEAAVKLEIADLGRKKHALEARTGKSGEITTLHDDAERDAKAFAAVDSRPSRAELEDILPATTRALLQFIERREAELDRVLVLQEEIRGLRKEARERQRSARAEAAALGPDEIEAARVAVAVPEGAEAGTPAEREAASASAWQKLKAGLVGAQKARAGLIDEYDQTLAGAGATLLEARSLRESNLVRYRSALLWTRDVSEISAESLDRARADLVAAPEKIAGATAAAARSAWGWFVSAIRDGRWLDLGAVLGALLLAGALLVAVHRRATKAFGSSPPDGSAALTVGRAATIGATFLRNVELTAFLAFVGVALPAIAGASRETVAICAAVFLPPLVIRVARTLIDLLFGAQGEERGLVGLPAGPSALIRRTCVLLLRVCACFAPLAILLGVTGYRDRNPGFVELLWLLNSLGCYLVVLGVLLRPSGVATLVRRKAGASDRASFLRAVVTAAYPFVIAAVIFLLVLRSLSYRVAARYFLERFLISAAWIAGAMLLRRWFLRILLGGEPKVAMPPAEWASDAPRYEAQGRRALFDRLRRLALTLVAFGPALFFVLDAWGLTGAGWDAVFNRPIALLSDLTLGNVVSATLTAVLAFFLVRSTRDFLRFVILPRTSLDLGVRYTIVTLTTYVLVAGSAVVILGGQLKVSPAVIGGFVAALGLGLGFGLQEIINNFFSGIILLVERPLKVGDTVSISGTTGRVDRINMRSTTIMTAENTGVIVPNKDLISSTVTNWSAGTPMIREAVALGIAYGSDTAEFKKIVLEVVESHGLVLKHPAPEVVFTNFGASSLDFSLRYWIRLGTSGSKVKSDLYFALDAAFRRHGIEMPYPTQDINVRTLERKEEATPPQPLPADEGRSTPARKPAAEGAE